MTADTEVERRSWRSTVGFAATLAAICGMLVFWAITAPPLASIDEPRHFNSVLRIMQGGGWPPPYTASLTEGTHVAMQEAGHPHSGVSSITPPAAADRSVVAGLTGTEYEGVTARDWMNQHPPTYYAIVAGVLSALGADDWRWDQLLMGMRLISVALVTAGCAFVLGSVRRIAGTAAATIIGVLAIISVPQFFNVLSLVTNDSLAILASSGFLYFLVRAWRTPRENAARVAWESVGAGVMLGLGLLTKGTLLAAIPVVGVTLLVIGLRLRGTTWVRRLAPAAISMAVAFAVGGWWYLRNILVYGEIQASNGGMGRAEVAADGYDLGEFITSALSQLAHTFWGSIRSTLELPTWAVLTLLACTLAALVITLVTSRDRLFIALLFLLPACVAGLILFHAWEVYWNEAYLAGVQGRYFFGGITIFCMIIAVAWARVVRRLPGWARAAAAVLVGGAMVAVGAWGARFAFRARWGSVDGVAQAWTDAAAAGPFGPAGLTGVVIVVIVAAAAAIAAAAALAMRPARAVEPSRVDLVG